MSFVDAGPNKEVTFSTSPSACICRAVRLDVQIPFATWALEGMVGKFRWQAAYITQSQREVFHVHLCQRILNRSQNNYCSLVFGVPLASRIPVSCRTCSDMVLVTNIPQFRGFKFGVWPHEPFLSSNDSSNMRFHVLGIGPIGSLVAFHLRRVLPPRIPVSLIVKTKSRARDLRTGGGIAIEHGGTPITQGGFEIEIFDPLEEVVFDLVYNKHGEMRLPSGATRTWRREGELSSAESMDIVQQPIESLIVCTKAQSTLGVFRRIKQRITSRSTIVLLQNGMGVYDSLVADMFRNPLERPQFVLATTTHAARSKSHGSMFHTLHTGMGDLAFGIVPDPARERDFEQSKWDPTAPPRERVLKLDDIAPITHDAESRDRCASLRETVAVLSKLTQLNPKWEPMPDLQVRLKRKLVTNSCINPMTAISQSSNGALFGNASARLIARKVCDEAAAVFAQEAAADAAAAGFGSEDSDADQIPKAPMGLRSQELQDEVFRVARRTSSNYSSMLVDMWKGRHTEIEHLNGYLHRLGLKYRVPTPSNDLLYDLIKLKEKVVPAARI